MRYLRIKIYGIVQGVGFRPCIARLFAEEEGSVKNCGSYVEVLLGTDRFESEGAGEEKLTSYIRNHVPVRADIVDIETEVLTEEIFSDLLSGEKPEKGEDGKKFFIAKSQKKNTPDEPVFIPPDLAICDDCARELYDPSNRRYLHPFINCTQCGPRLTIIDRLPYDRSRTSMKDFPMCEACEREYRDPSDRRYDAQPVCCNDCGPEVYFLEKTEDGNFLRAELPDAGAISRAREAIINGEIIAVKGIGGFHLYCDATNEAAVEELRRRKGRPAKPFAVMAADIRAAQSIVRIVPESAAGLLTGHRKPIVLLPKLSAENGRPAIKLAEGVSPGNPSVGVMLPYAPLQLLLFSYPDGLDEKMPQVLVATSANRSGGVICRDESEVVRTLGDVCDGILSHNRQILTRADDSVVDFFEGEPYMVRRSRGYAPLPVTLSDELKGHRDVLAFGGELKNTFCIGKGRLLYPSSYIGDLSDVNSDRALEETAERFIRMLDAHPSVAVTDLHPRYRSRACAEAYVKNNPGTKLIEVQHHYAHVLSVMAENHFYGQVIGAAYDGTGYGDDGTIWGGEIFLCDLNGYKRKWHISPFIFSGGDVASREGFRVALSMLFDKYENTQDICDIINVLKLCDEKYVRPLKAMHDRMMNSVVSTSCGRLFDAVSAVLGICRSQSFEGEASMGLQFAAESYLRRTGGHGCDTADTEGHERGAGAARSTAELFYRIVDAKLKGRDSGELAYFFHRELARLTVEEAVRIREDSGCGTAALSGGCFQNTLLLALTKAGLEEQGFTVLTAHEVPPNDGGISLGQCLKGMYDLRKDISGEKG
ncbi:MAG: carbamoyltransferase HypF [Candidatus Weimeria sp.]